jgi:hypothetical protein
LGSKPSRARSAFKAFSVNLSMGLLSLLYLILNLQRESIAGPRHRQTQ